jgi:putative transposase
MRPRIWRRPRITAVGGTASNWLQTAAIETAFIDPGKPWQNGADESFNGKFRNQHLSLQWFRNRLEAKVSIEAWRRHDNDVRPHSSLGYLTPAAFKAKHLLNNAPRSVVRTDDIL